MCAMLDLARSRLNFRWFYSMLSEVFLRKRRTNTKVSLLLLGFFQTMNAFCSACYSLHTFTLSSSFLIAMTVGNYKQTVSTILFQKRINLKTSLRKRHMLFMYLSYPNTTNFPAICGASYSTACACKQYNCWRCHEFKVYLPAVYKKLTDLQQMANLWFQSSSLR